MTTNSIRGVWMVLLAALLWGTTGTAQSFAPLQLSSYWVGTFRLIVAGLFLVVWLATSQSQLIRVAVFQKLQWRWLLLAALAMALYNLTFFAGVRMTGVAIGTAVALGSGPIWAGVLQFATSGRIPAAGWWLGVAVAIVGITVAIVGPGSNIEPTAIGLSLCVVSGFSYAVYGLVTKRLVAGPHISASTTVVFVLAGLVAAPVALGLAGPPVVTLNEAYVIAWLGVVSTGFAYLLFSYGLRHISAATGVALGLAEPVAAFGLAVLIVGERPGLIAGLGLLAVVGGLAILIRAEARTAEPH